MSGSINLSLTDELRAFVDQSSGDGTLYATPSEFVRDLIRQKKSQQESQMIRDGIIAGYHDAIGGKTHKFVGNLNSLLKKVN